MQHMSKAWLRVWRTHDEAAEPQEFIRYLEKVSEHPEEQELSRARLIAARLEPGITVLDLGCGIGSRALMLAEFVGPSGRTHAVDRSQTMLATTARRARERRLKINCHAADASSLPFSNCSFDAVWVERLLLHVPSPTAVLGEAFRVLRDRGRLVVMEADFAAVMFADGGDPDLAHLLEEAWAQGLMHARIGRSLERLARVVGFRDIRLEPSIRTVRDFELASTGLRWRSELASLVENGKVTKQRAEAWWQNLEAEARDGQVLAGIPIYTMFASRYCRRWFVRRALARASISARRAGAVSHVHTRHAGG
jgi:ubiquinone/menaquinone biosynthesis C-methylase UbiE